MSELKKTKRTTSKRTPEIEAEVIERMSTGETLTDIARSLGITPETWRNWCKADKTLDIAHAHARNVGFDAIAEDCLTIANTPKLGVIRTVKPDGQIEERQEDMLGHRKLQIETRLKLLAKWDPKRYGDKIEATHEIGDSITKIVREIVKPKIA